ncbi:MULTISPECIES: HD domain-containing phosphohydrolase [unclassified Duganella]|uniref:HD domain-containing phosphohydrolase n=1 Tax=unclassified Duganella TaxID=2636909 RepID=UPI000E34DF48|nr:MULTISPECIES: HD domain-containing phosphohydrolase [unclassified Duganella]RFP11445.1 response regulator [Duganella sp. BJB475]RFP29765.1 response regulator [Duganella sp. BJB476]
MKVVLVDDTHINLVLMSRLVDKLKDVSTISFQSAREALAWCNAHPYDLLIVDFMMPDLNGLELIARLEAPPDQRPPVLMVTASVDVDVRHRALENGASDFLIKPIDKVEFLARTRNMLALRSATLGLQHRATWLAEEVAKATAELRAREQETIMLLCRASEYRDPETGAHIQRMAHYSRLIAEQLGQSEEQQQDVLNAAPMHDIGKVGTPDHILLKPGRLNPEEMVVMRQHAEIGYNILKDCQARMLKLAAEIALTHHERYDGQGYPRGLAGEAIPLVGRIVAVADVFDALTSVRPYKLAWSMEDARQHLLDNCNTHFDPRCVEALLQRWDDVQAIRARFRDEPGAAALTA